MLGTDLIEAMIVTPWRDDMAEKGFAVELLEAVLTLTCGTPSPRSDARRGLTSCRGFGISLEAVGLSAQWIPGPSLFTLSPF
jgi:hypothetical protein